jgi:Flp pilus assembly protein TadD
MATASLRRSLLLAIPAVAAVAVYAATLRSAFVYDDEVLIRTNRWVHDAGVLAQLPVRPLLASPPVGTTNYYRPVVVILYNLCWHAGGGTPLAFHVLNVLLHGLNATLVMQLVRRIGAGGDAVAVAAATLFAVHPLTSEVVAWPSCLPELAYTALALSALLSHIGAWARTGPAALRLRASACALFIAACACKETALGFIPLVILLELWLRPRGGAFKRVLPYWIAAGAVLAARTAVLGGMLARGEHGALTALNSVWNAGWLVLLYWKSMLLPVTLVVEHVVPLATSPADPRFLIGLPVVVAAGLGAFHLRHTRPDLAIAACLAVIPLLPALWLPALGRDPFAERYAYLAVAGACWLAAGTAALGPRRLLPALTVVLAVAFSARTVARSSDWRDDGALGAATMRDEPSAPIGYMLLGNWHARAGRSDRALATFEDGVRHVPDSVELQLNATKLGLDLARLTAEQAVDTYRRMFPLAPGNATVPFNLGQALLQLGRRDEARAAFRQSLALAPASVPSITALAVIASQEGDAAEAARLCREALAIDDHSIQALQQLGVALLRTGDLPGATEALERAVRLDPADKDSLSRLGVAYARAGRLDDARRSWEAALALDPADPGALQNLERLRRSGR